MTGDERSGWLRAGPRRAVLPLAALLAVAAATLVGAVGYHAPCLGRWHGQQLSVGCYSDLQGLWDQRDLLHLHAWPYLGWPGRGFFDYPALTAAAAWLVGLGAHTATGFWWLTVLLLLAPAMALSVLALHRLAGNRALMLAGAPTVVLAGFLNWDLLAVAAVSGALLAWRRGAYRWAVVCLTVGTWLKLWPGLLLLALLVDREVLATRRQARPLLAIAAAVSVAVNLPFALPDLRGWLAPFAWQSARNVADINSLWQLVPHLGPGTAALLSHMLSVAAVAAALAAGAVAARRTGAFALPEVGLALLAGFVLLGPVHSPQYDLWFLPLLAASTLRVRWWAAFSVTSVGLYLTTFLGFAHRQSTPMQVLHHATAVAMAALLAALYTRCLGGELARAGRAASPVQPA